MVEHVKTVTLWILILLSVFLTYQIWTFQPKYEILKNTEYIENTQIGEEKKLLEVIKPKQIVYHQEDHFYSPINKEEVMQAINEAFQGASFDQFLLTPTTNSTYRNNTSNKLEYIFPTSIPLEALKESFQINMDDSTVINYVDRLLLYVMKEEEKEFVYVKFISNQEKLAIEAQTNIPVSKFKEDMIVNRAKDFYEVFPYDVVDYDHGFKKTVFLPVKSHFVNSVTYLAKPISMEHFKQLLFSDPNFVKHYIQINGEESFTDGNRMVNILQGGNVLRYINPTIGDIVERSNKHILFSSFDFVNGHGGLTNSFYFDSMKSLGSSDEITFRLMVDGIPVYHSNFYGGNNLFEITLQRGSGNLIEQYRRPLYYLEDEQAHITKSTKLPSGRKIIEKLNSRVDFDRTLLTDINYGFMMVKRQSFVTFEPSWFIQYNGEWEIMNIGNEASNSEAINNGLE